MIQSLSLRGLNAKVILFIIPVVAIVALTGAMLHERHTPVSIKNAPVTKNARTTNSNAQSKHTASTQTGQTAMPFLNIKEWGVKIPLPNAVSDAYYTMKSSNVGTDGIPNTAWLGLTSLNATGCNVANTGPTASATPLGSIDRVSPTDRDPVSGKEYSKLYPDGVTIGKYYYAFEPWANLKCAPAATLKSIDTAFATAAKGAVLDNH